MSQGRQGDGAGLLDSGPPRETQELLGALCKGPRMSCSPGALLANLHSCNNPHIVPSPSCSLSVLKRSGTYVHHMPFLALGQIAKG